ncbi:MAG: MarR family winged helix-turn-helix transcriptional regulator [Sciscionella sp.]
MVPHGKPLTPATADPVAALETQMMILVRNFALLTERHERDWGMDRAGYLLLRTLETVGPTTINGLAEAVGLDGSTVTRQVATMQDAGLVQRATDPEDRRCSIIRPTKQGVARMAEYRARRRDNVAKLTEGWSAHERRTLSKMLGKLNDSISALAAGDALPLSPPKRRTRARRFRPA